MTIADICRIIEEAGADHCYLSTDHFFDWTPSIPQQIYQVLGCLLEAVRIYAMSILELDDILHSERGVG